MHVEYNLMFISMGKCHRPIYGTPGAKGLNSIKIENDVEAMLTCITTDIHQSLSYKLIIEK